MDDPVIAALEVGRQRRQPSGELAEEAVVEAAHPGLRRARDMTALVAGARDNAKIGHDVHDADAWNQVALHRAGKQDVETAGHQVDEERKLAVPLRAGEPEVLPL